MDIDQIFSRFAHSIGAVEAVHSGIDEAPTEAGVVHFGIGAIGRAGLGNNHGSAGHIFDTPGQKYIAISGLNGVGGIDNGG